MAHTTRTLASNTGTECLQAKDRVCASDHLT
jgi:hypothetical protein